MGEGLWNGVERIVVEELEVGVLKGVGARIVWKWVDGWDRSCVHWFFVAVVVAAVGIVRS